MSDIKNNNSDLCETFTIEDENFHIIVEEECEDACSCITASAQDENEESPQEHSESKNKKPNPHLTTFLTELEQLHPTEAKVKHALSFMESSLAQNGTPHFKSFWEVRNICLKLFKENIPPALRAQFWTKYSELSKEARRLKEILDEQSSFAAEQIEIAIAALENDIQQFEERISSLENPEIIGIPKMLEEKVPFYQNIQKRLNHLNVQASRINGMRKELIKTEMRVRQKNKFFQRLSQAGDKIFPMRKDLIKDISAEFSQDVDYFIKNNFQDDFQDSLFVLREEIKGLQSIAKILTLNTHAFTHTRMCLSECWDKIKLAEKERKKERAQMKAAFKENYEAVHEKILDFSNRYPAEFTDEQATKHLEEISRFMRNIELGRDEIKALRDELSQARHKIFEKQRAQEQLRQQYEQEKEQGRRAKIEELKNEIAQLRQKINVLDAQELMSTRDKILEDIQNSSLNKIEKQEIERLFKPLRSTIADALSDKEEQAILSLSDDDRQAIDQLKEVLNQRKDRRQEIKNHLEVLRKASGNSGLDFEKAMIHNELINSEKERLEKINQGIKEIEDKIVKLQKKK